MLVRIYQRESAPRGHRPWASLRVRLHDPGETLPGQIGPREHERRGQPGAAYGADLAGRKPRATLRIMGSVVKRNAHRQNWGWRIQAPPRAARLVPDSGPVGPIWGPGE